MVFFSTTGLLLHVALFRLGTTHDCAIGQAGPSIWSSMPAMHHDAYGLAVSTASAAAGDGRALDRFGEATALDPGLALAHVGAGVCLFLEERFTEAQEAAKVARAA